MTHAFSDMLEPTPGPTLERRDEGLVDVTKIPPRSRTCCRCETLADRARAAGELVPPVLQAESWLRNGLRYFAGLCKDCGDWEWSVRWNARFRAAVKQEEKDALDRERVARTARGRRYYGAA